MQTHNRPFVKWNLELVKFKCDPCVTLRMGDSNRTPNKASGIAPSAIVLWIALFP